MDILRRPRPAPVDNGKSTPYLAAPVRPPRLSSRTAPSVEETSPGPRDEYTKPTCPFARRAAGRTLSGITNRRGVTVTISTPRRKVHHIADNPLAHPVQREHGHRASHRRPGPSSCRDAPHGLTAQAGRRRVRRLYPAACPTWSWPEQDGLVGYDCRGRPSSECRGILAFAAKRDISATFTRSRRLPATRGNPSLLPTCRGTTARRCASPGARHIALGPQPYRKTGGSRSSTIRPIRRPTRPSRHRGYACHVAGVVIGRATRFAPAVGFDPHPSGASENSGQRARGLPAQCRSPCSLTTTVDISRGDMILPAAPTTGRGPVHRDLGVAGWPATTADPATRWSSRQPRGRSRRSLPPCTTGSTSTRCPYESAAQLGLKEVGR